ncbi:GNAT family N-acetyltransferase [Pedobacter sp. SYSU D00535]|uniref:GNAT family N-acetyltransferase n=1 Tax=Pedobacter sp. SYSU D00535 TaxID=2810308 RepID=UPI001A969FEC|nr:GNAT family N-acetyltransferase [Pedobacter sp. SYSU D00535]
MIRAFNKIDTAAVVALLQLNTPTFFHPSEEEEYIRYLDEDSRHYFVVERSNQIIACGGINYGFDEGKTARISWDIVHPDWQRSGLGKELMVYRLKEISRRGGVSSVVVRTTQLVYAFYEKLGFALQKTERDFWAKGFDLYEMRLELSERNLEPLQI